MQRLIDICVRHRFMVIFCVLAMGAIGIRAAQHLPIDAVPDVTNVQVQILTNAPSSSPIEVEQYVTIPVERAMVGIPHVEDIRSLSRFGLSVVTVVFEEGTDLYFARQQVAERLSEAKESIPESFGTPEMGPMTTGLGEVFQFEVRSKQRCAPDAPDDTACTSLMELRELMDWTIVPQLRAVSGVADVDAKGGELKTWAVEVDPLRLASFNISLQQLFSALEHNNANVGGGTFATAGEQRVIRGEGLIQNLDDVRMIQVGVRGDRTPIYVRDVAQVRFAPMIRQGAVTRDGRGEVVTGTVMMRDGAHTNAVCSAVRERLAQINKTLPEDIQIDVYYDRSELVGHTIRTVATNLIEGGLLVILVLLLMLGNVRGGLLVAAVIPLSLLFTFISMKFFGVSGNLMSLGAIDFGLIIDGAIVVTEQINRRLAESKARGAAVADVVRKATMEVMTPVLFGTAIIMMVYVPILMLPGTAGKMFRPMGIAVLSALGAALILAITLVPAGASWVYKSGVRETKPVVARVADHLYAPILALALRFRIFVIAGAVALMAAGGWLASTMGGEFIPTLDEGAIAIQAIRPPSIALEEAIAATDRIEKTLREQFPDEVETVTSITGQSEVPTDPMGLDVSDIYVMLHPIKTWTRARTKEELVSQMRHVLERDVPGQNFSFSQPIELRTNELVSGSKAEVVATIHGADFEQLDALGYQLQGILNNVPGAVDIGADPIAGLPMTRFVVDRERAARYGVATSDILDAIAAMGGKTVGTIFEGEKRVRLQVRLQQESRANPEAMRDVLMPSTYGTLVPLAQVADIIEDEGPAVVNRQELERRLAVHVNVEGRDLAGFAADAQRLVEEELKLPTGYFIKWGGEFQSLQEAAGRLVIVVPIVLVLIFFLLYIVFGSFRPAILIYLNIPMAAVGGVAALWLRGLPLSISAAVGFIALSGIAVLNGVVMVSTIRDLQREGLSLFDATEKGANLRLRAVLMTAMTDGIGFLPMAIATTAGAEVQRPLATVVIGGLVTATLLTLVVLPALYSVLGGEATRDSNVVEA